MLGIAAIPGVGITGIYGAVIVGGLFGLCVVPFVGAVLRFFPAVVTGTIARFLRLKLLAGRRVRFYSITNRAKRHPEQLRDDLALLFEWLRDGAIDPAVHAVLPLDDVRRAHEMLERSEAAGKIVIAP